MSRVIVLEDCIEFMPEKKNLKSASMEVSISTPASYCLLLLLEKQGELVTHEALFNYAWRRFGMEATANTLYQNISVIRRGLSQCGLKEDSIRTMPRRGFILSPLLKVTFLNSDSLIQEKKEHKLIISPPESAETNPEERDLSDATHFEYAVPAPELNPAVPGKGPASSPEAVSTLQVEEAGVPLKAGLQLGYLLSALTCVLLTCGILLYVSTSSHFSSINYQYLTDYKDCEYYINSDGETDGRAIRLVHQLNKTCKYARYNYLTKYSEGGMVSVINCKKKLGYLSGSQCISEYITRLDDE